MSEPKQERDPISGGTILSDEQMHNIIQRSIQDEQESEYMSPMTVIEYNNLIDKVRADERQRTRQADIEAMCRYCEKGWERFVKYERKRSPNVYGHAGPNNEDGICGAGPIHGLAREHE